MRMWLVRVLGISAAVRWRLESHNGGIPLSSHIIGFSKPDHAPHRLYAHCDDRSVWRVLVFGPLGICYRVAR
ncbi:MAG: hypothetical protein GEV06_19870 [Luteitalea sp.]|nr:hypothetical protein [Luteitalea sp.]